MGVQTGGGRNHYLVAFRGVVPPIASENGFAVPPPLELYPHVDRCPMQKRCLPAGEETSAFQRFGGMYLQVSPTGSKRWFLKYRVAGAEKQLALGSYPGVTLTAARKARDAAKLQKSQGADPVMVRKVEKLKAARPDGDTFRAVALECYGKQSPQWGDSHAERSLRQLERDLFPWIGDRPMTEIHAMELLAALQKIEERGAIETADRVLMSTSFGWPT